MNYKGGDLVRVKTIKEMFETPGSSNILRYGMLDHHTETCSWDMVNEYQLQRDYPARIVKLSYNTGTIWVVEGENFILGEWMIASSAPTLQLSANGQIQQGDGLYVAPFPTDRLTQLEDRVNDFEEGYRQCDRCTADLGTQVAIMRDNIRTLFLKQQAQEDKIALLVRSIERTTDISGRF